MHNSPAPDLDKLWIITPISNPVRFESRYKTFEKFKTGIERVGANLLVVELALGDRDFVIADTVKHSLKLRAWDELWHKEAMINLALQRLPSDCKYVACFLFQTKVLECAMIFESTSVKGTKTL